jgi:hypothetical protein
MISHWSNLGWSEDELECPPDLWLRAELARRLSEPMDSASINHQAPAGVIPTPNEFFPSEENTLDVRIG